MHDIGVVVRLGSPPGRLGPLCAPIPSGRGDLRIDTLDALPGGIQMDKPAAIQIDHVFAHPPARVWRALTEPALHAQWWAAGDVRPEVGHRFELDMGPWGKRPCEVLAAEHERLFSFNFANMSKVTWRLQPEGDGTRLTLVHDGFDLDTEMGRQAYEGMGKGWPSVIARMEPVLEGLAA